MPRAVATPQPAAPVVIQQTIAPTEAPKEKERTRIELWSYMASLSPQDWRRHCAYLYRTRPIVGSKQAEKYLDKYTQKFTIEDIKERFGGEAFKVLLLRDEKPIANEEFSIEAAPKYDMSREIPSSENSRDAILRDLIERLDDKSANGSDATDVALGRSVDMMSKAFETALAKIASASGGNGANDPFVMIRLMKDLGLIGQPAGGGLRETILVLKELGLIGQQQNQFELFKSMLGVMKELSSEINPEPGPTNWKSRLIDKAVEAAPALINQFSGIMDKQAAIERERTQRAQIVTSARSNMNGPAPMPPPSPTPAAAPANPAPAAAASTEPMRTVPLDRNSAPAAAPASGQPSQEWVSNRVVQLIESGQSGESVVDFIDGINPAICQQLAGLTAEQIKHLFRADAILSRAVTLPNFDQWLSEVVEYLREDNSNTHGPN